MTYAIDPHNSWLALEREAERAVDAKAAANILLVRDHMEAEIKGQLAPLMATLTSHPKYHFWGRGEPMILDGRQAVEDFYSGMFAMGGEQFEVVVENVVADHGRVVTEGRVKQAQASAALAAMGLKEVDGSPVESSELWLSDAQLVTVWPIHADGKLVGEDIYFGVDPMSTLQPISSADLPPYYKRA